MTAPHKYTLYESRFGDILSCYWAEDGDGLALEWINQKEADDTPLNFRIPKEACRRLISILVNGVGRDRNA